MGEPARRGEVWLVDLGEPVGHEAGFSRPGLVVSDDPANRDGIVVLCPIGTARRSYPTRIEIEPGSTGLNNTSYVQCEQIRTVSSRRLTARLGVVDVTSMIAIERVLRLLIRL